jgi:hypothetical protein
VTPKQPFLDWLHAADPTSHALTLEELSHEPAIYLIRECDTPADVDEVLREVCGEIFDEQLAGWYNAILLNPCERQVNASGNAGRRMDVSGKFTGRPPVAGCQEACRSPIPRDGSIRKHGFLSWPDQRLWCARTYDGSALDHVAYGAKH